ncbi:MAG TPA: putative peptidoglycan glycosyltransferase FtsW [Stellaceae bacterium]|nr:putative peptidoglycan glycosyltransferase FtsW [Stellaceae bacterium]
MRFARIDQSPVARWWWTVDRWSLAALFILIGFGVIMSLAASPAVAERIGYDGMHFVRRYLAVLPVTIGVMWLISLQTPRTVRRIAVIGFAISMVLLALTFVVGTDIKGARRWIDFPLVALQPSEFVKPCFAIVAAWLFCEQKERRGFPGNLIAGALLLLIVGMLIGQPDVGMAVIVTAVWLGQFYLAGLRLYWLVLFGLGSAGGMFAAYEWSAHVRVRIDHFFAPVADGGYQVNRSLEAFANGGLWGRGPGEGTIKYVLPDAHADFVFAVAGEELGLVVCLVLVGLFTFVVLRGFARLRQENSLFVLLSAAGLLIQFGLQAVINMASTLHLMPTKGMTLPFLSYGGSSMLSLGLAMGMLLALTRRRLAGSAL